MKFVGARRLYDLQTNWVCSRLEDNPTENYYLYDCVYVWIIFERHCGDRVVLLLYIELAENKNYILYVFI